MRGHEEEIIARLFLYPELLDEAKGVLEPDHFEEKHLGDIYGGILRFFPDGEFTPFSFPENVRNYIVDLVQQASLIKVRFDLLMRIVVERHTIRETKKIFDAIEEQRISFGCAKKMMMERMDSVSPSISSPSRIYDLCFSALEAKAKGGSQGLHCGLSSVDEYLGGFHKSDLIVVAGRPGMGKTAFALTLAKNVASGGACVLFFSLEMPSIQIVERLMAAETGMDISGRSGQEIDFEMAADVAQNRFDIPLFVSDDSSHTFDSIKGQCVATKPDFVVIDYLQLIRSVSKSENRVAEITVLTRQLKCLARELDIPVVVLSQLSRASEKRDSKQPVLSDLRDSGSIEQDADIVMFPYRPGYHDKTISDNDAILIIGKNRHGCLGEIPMKFYPSRSVFVDR